MSRLISRASIGGAGVSGHTLSMRIIQLRSLLLSCAALTGALLVTSAASATERPGEPGAAAAEIVDDGADVADVADVDICLEPEAAPSAANSTECTLACKSECGCSTIACIWACGWGDYPNTCDGVC